MQVARGANGCGGHGPFNTAQCPQMQTRFSFSTIVQIHFCVALAKWKLAKMHKYANSSHYKYLTHRITETAQRINIHNARKGKRALYLFMRSLGTNISYKSYKRMI